MPNDIVIRAILDCSAILSYAHGHVHVGELMIEIADEEAYVGLPALALLEAYTQVGAEDPARDRLRMLVALPNVVVFPVGSQEAASIATIVPLTKGDLPRAHAVWAALRHGSYYVTVEPHLVPPNIAANRVQAIPADDV
jgi:hypothetical protein